MKQGIALIIVVLLFTAPGLVLAQAPEAGMMEHKDMTKEHGAKCSKCAKPECPIMKSLLERKIIATTDGGVVVILGNKLAKYDQDLDLVKEVELTTDIEGLKKLAEGAKGGCPMGKKNEAAENKEEAKPVAEPAVAVEPATVTEEKADATAEPLVETPATPEVPAVAETPAAVNEPAAVPAPEAANPAETPSVNEPASGMKTGTPAAPSTEEKSETKSSVSANTTLL